MSLPAQVPGACASPARPSWLPPAPRRAEPTLGSHRASTHTYFQPLSPPALPGVGFWALFPHMVPIVGRCCSAGFRGTACAAPRCPPWHGRSPQGTAQGWRLTELPATAAVRAVTVLKRVLGFPPLEDKSLPLQRPQPQPKPPAPEQCRGFLRAAPQGPELCGTPLIGTRRPQQPGGPSGTAPTAPLRPLWAACGEQRLPATPAPHSGTRCGSRGLRHLPQDRAGTLRAGGGGGALPSRARPAGGSGVWESRRCCGSGAGPAAPGPLRAPSTESRGRDRAPSISEGLQASTKESSRKELIKEFQFPSTQPLVLCERKTKPGHSHC